MSRLPVGLVVEAPYVVMHYAPRWSKAESASRSGRGKRFLLITIVILVVALLDDLASGSYIPWLLGWVQRTLVSVGPAILQCAVPKLLIALLWRR